MEQRSERWNDLELLMYKIKPRGSGVPSVDAAGMRREWDNGFEPEMQRQVQRRSVGRRVRSRCLSRVIRGQEKRVVLKGRGVVGERRTGLGSGLCAM